MSKIALTPNASGTGVFTISSPATNTDRTLTLPDEAGSIVVNTATGIDVTGVLTTTAATVFNGGFATGAEGLAFFDLGAYSATAPNNAGFRIRSSASAAAGEWAGMTFQATTGDSSGTYWQQGITSGAGSYASDFVIKSSTGASSMAERLKIDSSGNVIVGPTSNYAPVSLNVVGVSIRNFGEVQMSSQDQGPLYLNRKGTDGAIINLRHDNADVGFIGSLNVGMYISAPNNGGAALVFNDNAAPIYPSKNTSGVVNVADNYVDLGAGGLRFKVIYAATGSINTSDRNEKQDIDVMSEAETRVAVACKGLMRKFRWKDAVAEKGDDARIHFGIIAQDLQDAFAAEGLDASRYAMFCSDTWWETQTDVPAVEAVAEVLDEEGNVVTEAVGAKEAYTRTDHYDILEKAPEGATERTRLGVRYSELLAFIIGAL